MHRADASQRDPPRRGCVHQRARPSAGGSGARGHDRATRSRPRAARSTRPRSVGSRRRPTRPASTRASRRRTPDRDRAGDDASRPARSQPRARSSCTRTPTSGFTSMFGDNALDSARRAQLVDDANAGGDAAIAQLTAAVDNLNAATAAASKPQRRTTEERAARGRDASAPRSTPSSPSVRAAGPPRSERRAGRGAQPAARDRRPPRACARSPSVRRDRTRSPRRPDRRVTGAGVGRRRGRAVERPVG